MAVQSSPLCLVMCHCSYLAKVIFLLCTGTGCQVEVCKYNSHILLSDRVTSSMSMHVLCVSAGCETELHGGRAKHGSKAQHAGSALERDDYATEDRSRVHGVLS